MCNKNNKFNTASRRRFLKRVGATAASIAIAPYIGGVRRANAARGSAIACIRFFLSGGARTSAMWDSNHSTKYNPYGIKYTTAPTGVAPDFFISNLWPDSMLGVLPDISVVRTVYHGDRVGTGHSSCQQRMLTGGIDDTLPGWATVVNRELASNIPAVQIGDSNDFAEQFGSLGPAFASLEIPNARSVQSLRVQQAGLPGDAEMRRLIKLRNAVSLGSIQRTAFSAIRDLPFQQALARDIIAQISSGLTFDIKSSGDSARLGTRISTATALSNGELRSIFGVSSNGRGNEYGGRAMLALRLVQSGVRSVTIERGGWDTHGNEQGRLTRNLAELGQAISGLVATLKDLPSLSGLRNNALEDVVIVVDSEFGRDNTGANGFNGNDGSDHQSRYARFFSVMFAGGGVAGGQAIGATDVNFDPVNNVTYHSSQINATIYDLLGIDPAKYLSEPPIEDLYT